MVPAYEIWFYCIEHVKGNNFENIQVLVFLIRWWFYSIIVYSCFSSKSSSGNVGFERGKECDKCVEASSQRARSYDGQTGTHWPTFTSNFMRKRWNTVEYKPQKLLYELVIVLLFSSVLFYSSLFVMDFLRFLKSFVSWFQRNTLSCLCSVLYIGILTYAILLFRTNVSD